MREKQTHLITIEYSLCGTPTTHTFIQASGAFAHQRAKEIVESGFNFYDEDLEETIYYGPHQVHRVRVKEVGK